MSEKKTALNPRAAWPFPAKLVIPHRFIEFKGERWVEVEWPSDGRYNIGYQLAHEVDGAMRLFELASRRIKP
jgi:hypothetical protein